jgi:hypothetical protein
MQVEVVLSLRDTNNAQILVDTDHYTNCMTGNVNFGAADIITQITSTKTAATGLRTAINAPTSDTKKDNILAARDGLDRNLVKLGGKVEGVANDPATLDINRVSIVHSAGMIAKGHTSPGRHTFTVTNGAISGTALLQAQGGNLTNEWQYTTDLIGFTNRVAADTTSKASAEIPGLVKKTEYAFFHKGNQAGVKTNWEGPIFLVIT